MSLGLIWILFALTEKLFSSSSPHVFNFKESDQWKQWEELRVGEGVGPGERAKAEEKGVHSAEPREKWKRLEDFPLPLRCLLRVSNWRDWDERHGWTCGKGAELGLVKGRTNNYWDHTKAGNHPFLIAQLIKRQSLGSQDQKWDCTQLISADLLLLTGTKGKHKKQENRFYERIVYTLWPRLGTRERVNQCLDRIGKHIV